MYEQNTKTFYALLKGGFICLIILILELLVEKAIAKNNMGNYETYARIIYWFTIFGYIVFAVIKMVQHQRNVENYKKERVDEAIAKLSEEYKPVFIKYSEPISKDKFKCEAKVSDDGKIICHVTLDSNFKFDNYDEFLKFFRLSE